MSTATMQKTPLESWITKKIGLGGQALTIEHIRRYQLQKLREIIRSACLHSPFYRNLLKGFAETEIASLADLRRFPFTTADDIRQHGLQFLSVSQSDISRVVTLDSSGTTGQVKRLYFTPFDQELTLDFFQQGMSTLVHPGERVLILLPGERTGSVGALLATALNRLGARPIPHGVVRNLPDTLEIMAREKADSLVAIPAQALALAHYGDIEGRPVRLKSVLLSTDHVPGAVVRELERVWGCQVFEHYGMTEMGLGGGVDCEAHAGYHLREADLYFEIVDPLTREPVPEGQDGEVVFTTLTRQGMPLIRYCTGDISRFLPEPCRCGTVLRRLARITKRKNSRILISENRYFCLSDLDEVLFAVRGVISFTASVDNRQRATRLVVAARTAGQDREDIKQSIDGALNKVPAIYRSRQDRTLKVTADITVNGETLSPSTAKRTVMELNKADGIQDDLFDQTRQNSTGR